MKRQLLFTCMLVLGMLSVPMKVIGEELLPDIYGLATPWTVEGTAGTKVKWRVYGEDYSLLLMQASGFPPNTVTNNWVITATKDRKSVV